MDIERLAKRISGLTIQSVTGDFTKLEITLSDGSAVKIRAVRGFMEIQVGRYEFEEEFTI